MPTYEYRCKDCSHQFDIVQSFSDDSLTECPECGGTLKKVFGNVGISFKGSGFYKTDSRTDGPSGPTGEGDSSESKKDGSSSTESSSSPATTESSSSGAAASSGSTTSTTPAAG